MRATIAERIDALHSYLNDFHPSDIKPMLAQLTAVVEALAATPPPASAAPGWVADRCALRSNAQIGAVLQARRKQLGVSQTALAAGLPVPRSRITVTNAETGRIDLVSPRLDELCALLGLRWTMTLEPTSDQAA